MSPGGRRVLSRIGKHGAETYIGYIYLVEVYILEGGKPLYSCKALYITEKGE